jgi:hypothetical protein
MGNTTSSSVEISNLETVLKAKQKITPVKSESVTPVYRVDIEFSENRSARLNLWLNQYTTLQDRTALPAGQKLTTYLTALDRENEIYREILNKLNSSVESCSPHFFQLGFTETNISFEQIRKFVDDDLAEFVATVTMGYVKGELPPSWKFNYSIVVDADNTTKSWTIPLWMASTLAVDPAESFENLTNIILQTMSACYVNECTGIIHQKLSYENLLVQEMSDVVHRMYVYRQGEDRYSMCLKSKYTTKVHNFTAAMTKLIHSSHGSTATTPPETAVGDFRTFIGSFGQLRTWNEEDRKKWEKNPKKQEVVDALSEVLATNIPGSLLQDLRTLVGEKFVQGFFQENENVIDFINVNIEEEEKNVQKGGDLRVLQSQKRALKMYREMYDKREEVWAKHKALVTDWLATDDYGNHHLTRWHPGYGEFFEQLKQVLSVEHESTVGYWDELINLVMSIDGNIKFLCPVKPKATTVYTCDPTFFDSGGGRVHRTIAQYFEEIPEY